MRYCIIIIFLFSIHYLKGYAQEIDSYKFNVHAIYLPFTAEKSEYYSKNNNKLAHYSEKIIPHKNKYKKTKSTLSKIDIQDVVTYLDSLSDLNKFSFEVDSNTINKIKNYPYNNKDVDIDNFIINGKVTLNIDHVKTSLLDNLSVQLDGVHYQFYLELKKKGVILTQRKLYCGSGGVSNAQIKDWIILYLTFEQHKIFETLPELRESCFSQDKLISIITRFTN